MVRRIVRVLWVSAAVTACAGEGVQSDGAKDSALQDTAATMASDPGIVQDRAD